MPPSFQQVHQHPPKGSPFNTTIVQVYVPTSDCDDNKVEHFYDQLQYVIYPTSQAEIIAEEQASFRAERSITEQIFNLTILCEKYLQHQQDLCHVVIDFKKAFERVWHAAL